MGILKFDPFILIVPAGYDQNGISTKNWVYLQKMEVNFWNARWKAQSFDLGLVDLFNYCAISRDSHTLLVEHNWGIKHWSSNLKMFKINIIHAKVPNSGKLI